MEQGKNKYDNHTVFIKCSNEYSENDIIDMFQDFLYDYMDESGDDIRSDFYVNIISNKDDVSYGLAFVYITNSEVYHMLFGRNKDGTERVEYINDPNWVAPPRSRTNSNSASLKLSEERKNAVDNKASLFKLDWGSIMEADEEHEKQETAVKNKYVCPKIKVSLGPLMSPMVDSKPLHIEQALPSEVKNGYHSNIIKSSILPESITIEDLNEKFKPFVTNKEAIYQQKVKGCIIEHPYPYIVINNKTAYIIFDEKTSDAKFAIHMTKKSFIKKEKLWFDFSYKSDVIENTQTTNHHNKNSPKNYSPKNNYNNNSPKNNYNNNSPKNNNNPKNNRNNCNNSHYKNNNNNKKDDDEDAADTDGFKFVKYNRK